MGKSNEIMWWFGSILLCLIIVAQSLTSALLLGYGVPQVGRFIMIVWWTGSVIYSTIILVMAYYGKFGEDWK